MDTRYRVCFLALLFAFSLACSAGALTTDQDDAVDSADNLDAGNSNQGGDVDSSANHLSEDVDSSANHLSGDGDSSSIETSSNDTSYPDEDSGWARGDLKGDGRSDLIMFNDMAGRWDVMESHSEDGVHPTATLSWGQQGAIPVVGDFNGDGRFDPAYFVPEPGEWFIRSFFEDTVLVSGHNWGYSGTVPVSGDYTGDGRDDFAVYFEDDGLWYIYSLDGTDVLWEEQWGGFGMVPVPGDYTGDGKADLAVFAIQTGQWFIRTIDETVVLWEHEWGGPQAVPVPGDYTGNGRADLAVFQPSTGEWFVQEVDGLTLHDGLQFGWHETIPVSGDYNGDGRSDLAVYAPTTKKWYIQGSEGEALFWEHTWGEEDQFPAMGVRPREIWGGTYATGDIVPIHLDYARHWILTLRGEFAVDDHMRFLQSGHDLRQGLDLFRWDRRYALRLFDRKVLFTSANLGSISSPEPPDHWALTVQLPSTAQYSGEIQIKYDPAGRARLYRDDQLVGDWSFQIDEMPPPRDELRLLGFSGEVILDMR